MQHQEILILKQKLLRSMQRITYLQDSIIAKDRTIQILQDKIDFLRQSYRIYHSQNMNYSQNSSPNPRHNSSVKSYDSIQRIDHQDNIREYLQVQLCESGNFDNTLDQNQIGQKPMLKIPEFQKIPFFEHSSSNLSSSQSPRKSSSELKSSIFQTKQYEQLLDNYSSLRVNQDEISLFKSFMIIGSDRTKPFVMFRYPFACQCEEGILELVYPSTLLKPIGKSKGYNDLIRTASNTIKDKIIIPLKRPQLSEKQFNKTKERKEEYQYLIGFQVQDIYCTEEDISTHPIFYCFLSDHKCINLFYELTNLIINTVNGSKNKISLSRGIGTTTTGSGKGNLNQFMFGNNLLQTAIKQSELQVLLSRIHRNKFEYNQHLRIKLNKDQVFIEEIPAKQNESDLIFLNALSVSMSTFKVTCKFSNNNVSFECNMILLMLVYFSCEKRIVIYSTSKQKVSMSIMLLLELIKPLEYVNPIIQGQFKEQYLEFIDAPMAMLIGLWGEKKSTKKLDLSYRKLAHTETSQSVWKDEFEKQKIKIKDGLIFNLDTEKVYGQSDSPLNNVATFLSKELKKYSMIGYYRRVQSLFQMVMNFDIKTDWAILLRNRVEATQMYCYHKEMQKH